MAANKYLKNNAGNAIEETSVDASAGAGDAGKIVALNASGVLDSTKYTVAVTGTRCGGVAR